MQIEGSIFFVAAFLAGFAASQGAPQEDGVRKEPSLQKLFRNYFSIGFGSSVLDEPRSKLLRHHASVVTCENDLKIHRLRPGRDEWHWDKADAWLLWVESLGLEPVGHTLVWPHHMPRWVEELIADGAWTRAQALAWQRNHIQEVLLRYRGRIRTWDVVNEALGDESETVSDGVFLRRDPWSDLCGVDYVIEAFRAAREAAPDAVLIYNDYGLEGAAKRAQLFKLLKILEEAGCRPDAIGLQGHHNLEGYSTADIEQAICEIHAVGYPIHITELDISIHPSQTPPDAQSRGTIEAGPAAARKPLSREIAGRQAERYRDLFEVFLRHSDKIERVGFWNTDDANSWLNNFPVVGRPDYPLLFDERLMPKPAFFAVTDLVKMKRSD